MKKISYIIVTLILYSLFSCEDVITGPKEPEGPWNCGPITGISVTPINGGAKISYDIPENSDVLYVMAEYERNGKKFTEKSSIHKNMLVIEGFHRVNQVKATLYAVNRYEQRSEPVTVKFEPLESLIDLSVRSLEIKTAFGGIIAKWENLQTTELGVRLMTYDDSLYHALVTREMYFTKSEKESRSFRGFPAVETTFAIAFEDKWGNVSDTVQLTTTPYFETMVEKPYADFRANIPYDNISNLSTIYYPFSNLFDNIVNEGYHGWLSNPGSSGLSITIDMKQRVKLSRILTHAYHINDPFGQLNPTIIEVWGTDKIDYGKLSDLPYWLDEWSVRNGYIKDVDPTTPLPERTFKDDWVYLGLHRNEKPSDPNVVRQMAVSGLPWEMPDAAPVRYVRIFARETALMIPRSDCYFALGEITFYGDNTVSQE